MLKILDPLLFCAIRSVSIVSFHFLWSISPLFTVNCQYLNKSLLRASLLPKWGILSLALQSSLKITSFIAHNTLCCSNLLSCPHHKLQEDEVHLFFLNLFFSFTITSVMLMLDICSVISTQMNKERSKWMNKWTFKWTKSKNYLDKVSGLYFPLCRGVRSSNIFNIRK